jgi:hypothetical protein
MPLFASPLKVVYDPTGTNLTLLNHNDDKLTAWPVVSGGQRVALVDRVTATARKGFSRGNEFNSITLAWLRDYETPEQAIDVMMRWPSSRPKARALVAFYPENTDAYSLADALITNWDVRAEGCLVYFTLKIEGGTLTYYND